MHDELRVQIPKSAEQKRLDEARERGVPWKQWGPYLSERQWGTVREDYSETGDAWNYFTHEHARSRAYHWGEDGLAGISVDHQRHSTALVRSTAGGGGFGGPGSTRIAHQHGPNLRRRIHPRGRPERECECREEPFGVP